jgi:hypothetical protein
MAGRVECFTSRSVEDLVFYHARREVPLVLPWPNPSAGRRGTDYAGSRAMQKLTLNVEELRVDAFETAAGAATWGTVHGHEDVSKNPDVCFTLGSCGHICP